MQLLPQKYNSPVHGTSNLDSADKALFTLRIRSRVFLLFRWPFVHTYPMKTATNNEACFSLQDSSAV